MARYQVILAYDGAGYFGFQRQASGPKQRTVQAVLETALRQLGWQGKAILASGRTDTGVHASGQVIAFDLDWAHSPEALRSAINAHLPPDVAVQSVTQAAADFHPRYAAQARRYHYRLFCQPVRHPLRERYAWRVWPPVDPVRLREASAYLYGTHDFAAFGAPPRAGGSTVRTVTRAEWIAISPDELAFEITANAFLFRMVRRLTGFQVAIGQGMFEPQAMRDCMESGSRELVKKLAPPHGLTLVEVTYRENLAASVSDIARAT
jgi:tRNA pseudouridine38-40 synthase